MIQLGTHAGHLVLRREMAEVNMHSCFGRAHFAQHVWEFVILMNHCRLSRFVFVSATESAIDGNVCLAME